MKTYAVKVNDVKFEVETGNVAEAAKKAIVAYLSEAGKTPAAFRLEIELSAQAKVRKVG